MKHYLKPLSIKLIAVLLLAIVVAIIHSCRKDTRQSSSPSAASGASVTINIAELKKIYATSVTNNGLLKLNSGGGSLNLIHTLDVNWNTYTLQKRRDSSIVAEFDMNNDTGLFVLKPIKLGDTIKYINKTTATFIQYKNGSRLNFFTKIIEDLTSAGSHSVIQKLHYNEVPLGFSGLILYYTFGLNFINGYHYTNGVIDKTVSSLPTVNTGSQSINSLQANTEATCEAYPIYRTDCTTYTTPYGTYVQGCTTSIVGYDVECDGGDTPGAGGGVSGDSGGGPGAPTPCTPSSSNTVASASVSNGRLIINVTTGGGSGGSGGGTTPPPCPTTPPPNDPCSQLAGVVARAISSFLAGQNAQLLNYANNSADEYGTSQNLMSLTGSTYNENIPITTDGFTDQFTPPFSWDNTNGHTVGFSHDHPENNPPDPFDVFPMVSDATNANLTAAPSSDMQFYQNNISSTIVTLSGNYVITVNNWVTLQSVYNQLLPLGTAAIKAQYQQYASNYQINNSGATLIEAGEYALLKMFGNSINLYTANSDSNTAFTPLTIDSSGTIAKIQCP